MMYRGNYFPGVSHSIKMAFSLGRIALSSCPQDVCGNAANGGREYRDDILKLEGIVILA